MTEAEKCLGAEAYAATAVFCGKAIELTCKLKTNASGLEKGLKTMRSEGLIDEMIYSWGDALRKKRNLGAHEPGDAVSRQDAADVFDFARAIAEYVFVLSEQYEEFVNRS